MIFLLVLMMLAVQVLTHPAVVTLCALLFAWALFVTARVACRRS